MNKFKLFWKENCPTCPAAKDIINQLETRGWSTEGYNIETTEGLAEAAFYSVLSTPTIILTDKDDNPVAEWRGNVPALEEALGQGLKIQHECN